MAANSKESTTLLQKLYYVSFTGFALAGIGYIAYKIYTDSQASKADRKRKRRRDHDDDSDFEAEVQRRLEKRSKAKVVVEEEPLLTQRSLSPMNRDTDKNKSFKNGLIKEYVVGKEAGGFTVGKGQGSGRVKLLHVLSEIKSLCGADVVLIKADSRKKRRNAADDGEYFEIVNETNDKLEYMIEDNIQFVIKKYCIERAELDNMIEQNHDEEIVNLLNGLCASEMYFLA